MSGHGAIADGERRSPRSTRRLRAKTSATDVDCLRSPFLGGLSLIWDGWRAALRYVQPDTVVRWQRERFRKFWARLSRGNRRRRCRPATAVEIPLLIGRMVAANPLWRAPRIHGELKMLGIAEQCPIPRPVSRIGRIIEIPQLGGLHHRYERVAA
jgi:hypothetical protein